MTTGKKWKIPEMVTVGNTQFNPRESFMLVVDFAQWMEEYYRKNGDVGAVRIIDNFQSLFHNDLDELEQVMKEFAEEE